MTEFFYLIKIGVTTVLFIILMQTNWDNKPIESHLMTWIRTSSIIEPVRSFSERGAVLVRKVYKDTTALVDSKLKTSSQKSDRRSSFTLKRDSSVEEKKRKQQEAMERLESDQSQAGF